MTRVRAVFTGEIHQPVPISQRARHKPIRILPGNNLIAKLIKQVGHRYQVAVYVKGVGEG